MVGYAKLVNGELEFAPYFVEKNGASILGYNFESNIETMIADGYKPVKIIDDKSSYNDGDGTFLFEFEDDGEYLTETAVFHKYSDEDKAQRVRDERNQKLESTDKIVSTPDYPVTEDDRQLFIAYRQYLRDIPQNEGFPWVKVKTFEQWRGE